MYPGCPIPGAISYCDPEGSGSLGVLILGESCGDKEAKDHLPFRPYAAAGSVLERAIRRCGYNRSQFVLFNVCPVQPPNNWMDGAPWEREAIVWGQEILKGVITRYKPRCILALGNVPLKATTGLTGEQRSVSHLRGWPIPALAMFDYVPVVASFHPSFLRRGAMPLFSVLMHDIKLAVAVANSRVGQTVNFYSPVLSRDVAYTAHDISAIDMTAPVVPDGYTTSCIESQAWDFYEQCKESSLISFDIETPRSAVTSEIESDELEEQDIISIQFSLARDTGIFFPWREPFIEIAKRILSLPNPKAGANVWRFDCPRLRAHGCEINGTIHDTRWAFHALQPDLRGSLQFVASFYNDGSGRPWKHLAHSHKAEYGILDVDWVQRILG